MLPRTAAALQENLPASAALSLTPRVTRQRQLRMRRHVGEIQSPTSPGATLKRTKPTPTPSAGKPVRMDSEPPSQRPKRSRLEWLPFPLVAPGIPRTDTVLSRLALRHRHVLFLASTTVSKSHSARWKVLANGLTVEFPTDDRTLVPILSAVTPTSSFTEQTEHIRRLGLGFHPTRGQETALLDSTSSPSYLQSNLEDDGVPLCCTTVMHNPRRLGERPRDAFRPATAWKACISALLKPRPGVSLGRVRAQVCGKRACSDQRTPAAVPNWAPTLMRCRPDRLSASVKVSDGRGAQCTNSGLMG